MERDVGGDVSEKQLASRPRLVGDPGLTPIKIVESEFFIDETARKQEQERLSRETSLTQDSFTFTGRTSREMDRWELLEEKCNEIQFFKDFVNNELLQILSNPASHTIAELSILRMWDLAGSLLFQANLNELKAIARKNSVEDKFTHLSQLWSFNRLPELSIRIGQVSIQDFPSFNTKNTNSAPFYQYLVESQRIRIDNTHEQVLEQNQEYPKNIYPNLTRQAIDFLPAKTFAFTTTKTSSDISARNAVKQEPIVREVSKHLERFLGKVQDVRIKVYKTLLDSSSEDFLGLSQLVHRYLRNGDKSLKILAINMIVLSKEDRIFEMYRKARKNEAQQNSQEFYSILADSIREYAEEVSPLMNILSNDDVPAILDADKVQVDEEQSESTFMELGKRVNEAFSKTSQKNFTIEPSNINWANLHVPQEVQINFDPNRPRKFTINISFNSELGESTEVECILDTTKNFMDWNHPEDPLLLPDDPDLRALRRSLLIAAQSILDNVYKQAEDEYQLKLQSKDKTSPAVVVQRPKRERAQDPVYQLRRDTRAQQREGSINQGGLFEILSQKEEIKNRVILPSDEEFEDMVRYLSHVDREIIRRSIEEYNEKGTGAKFARKKRTGLEGEHIYGLSIGCTVPKGARVLLRETESEAGARNFEIIDIRYRKDIYSEHKL